MTQVNTGGRPPKLTEDLIRSVSSAIATGAPMHWACSYVTISEQAVRIWRSRATVAGEKIPRLRSQHERLCLRFFEETESAAARFFMNGWSNISLAARPSVVTRTVTTTKTEGGVAAPDGTITGGTVTVTVVSEEKQVPGDWKAMFALMSRRFRADMAESISDASAPPAAIGPTPEEAIAILTAARAEQQGLRLVAGS